MLTEMGKMKSFMVPWWWMIMEKDCSVPDCVTEMPCMLAILILPARGWKFLVFTRSKKKPPAPEQLCTMLKQVKYFGQATPMKMPEEAWRKILILPTQAPKCGGVDRMD